MSKVSNIRIIDPHVIKLVEDENRRTGESNPTKTAQRMIVERAAQKEMLELAEPGAASSVKPVEPSLA